MRLTDIAVKALPPPQRGAKIYADDTLPGFGLRVSQGGAKAFVLTQGKRRERTTIGRYPIISLADARLIAKTILAERTLGRHRQRTSRPFQDTVQAFLVTKEANNRPRTAHAYSRLLKRHFNFGQEQLCDITRDDIMKRVRKLSDTPSEQAHTFNAVCIFFRWATRNAWLQFNPLAGMDPYPVSKPRARTLSITELVDVWFATDQDKFGTIVRLLILTGQRRSEIAALEAEWIAPDIITFPEWITKNKQEHIFPYGPMVEEQLLKAPKEGYVFPAGVSHVRGKPTTCFNGWSKARASLQLDIEPFTLHDLRRSYKSGLSRIGCPDFISERLLNHISNVSKMSRTYDTYDYMPEKREWQLRWEAHLAEAISARI